MSPVSTIMTREIISVRPGDTARAVAGTLALHRISAAPVLDDKGQLVGIVSEGDLMHAFGARHDLRRAWWLNMLAEGEQLAPEFLDYIRLDHRKASDFMTQPVVTATEAASLPEIADLLTEHHIKRVPLLRDGRMVGIVSRADIVRAIAAG